MKRLLPIIFLLLLASTTAADGCFFIPYNYFDDVLEPQQKAIIIHDGEQEHLFLEVSYKGNMTDFAWVVPTPAIPKVNVTDQGIFNEASQHTRAIYRHAPNVFRGMMFGASLKAMDATLEGVDVLEQQQLDVFEATTLAATDAGALAEWLEQNGYAMPEHANEILQPYVDNGWHYVAFKINLQGYFEEFYQTMQTLGYEEVKDEASFVNALTDIVMERILADEPYNSLNNINEAIDLDTYNNIIDEYSYNHELYEHNGYPDEEVKRDMTRSIEDRLEEYSGFDKQYRCYDETNREKLKNDCYAWRVLPEDEAYQIASLSGSGPHFIAEVAAAIIDAYEQDNPAAIAYIGQVHYSSNDDLKDKKDRLERQSQDKVRYEVGTRLATAVNLDIGAQLPTTFFSSSSDLSTISTYTARAIFDDIKAGKAYEESFTKDLVYHYVDGISESLLMTEQTYNKWRLMHEGHHDEQLTRRTIQQEVQRNIELKEKNVDNQLDTGTLKALHFTFPARTPVYPLRISAINKGTSEVLLYIFSEHKMDITSVDGFTLERAVKLEPEDLENQHYHYLGYYYGGTVQDADDKTLKDYLTDEYYVTKYRAEMTSEDMTNDVYFQQAANDKEFRIVKRENNYFLKWAGFIIGVILLSIPGYAALFGAFLLVRLAWNKWVPKKKVNIKRVLLYPAPFALLTMVDRSFDLWEALLTPFKVILFDPLDYFLPDFLAAIIVGIIVVTFWFIIIRLFDHYFIEKKRRREEVPPTP